MIVMMMLLMVMLVKMMIHAMDAVIKGAETATAMTDGYSIV
jgi:hypothetical protein